MDHCGEGVFKLNMLISMGYACVFVCVMWKACRNSVSYITTSVSIKMKQSFKLNIPVRVTNE